MESSVHGYATAGLAGSHAACDILGLEPFNEDDLYENLDWLDANQSKIEDSLFKSSYPDKPPGLYLYDVTSSYLEGQCNELAAFGYNRDGKKGKRQIVIGLLCDEKGKPLSIEVFTGNTNDTATVASQIQKVAQRFGGGEITFVGDPRGRGMIKSRQVEELAEYGFHYITAISKPQIETLIKQGAMEMALFDQPLAEITTDDGIRYILRRSPQRAIEIRQSRDSKLDSLRQMMKKQNEYLATHSRASEHVALRKINDRCEKLKVGKWVVAEGIHELTTLCATEVLVKGQPRCHKIPQPRSSIKQLLEAASVRLPEVLPCQATRVATRKKLPENRATP